MARGNQSSKMSVKSKELIMKFKILRTERELINYQALTESYIGVTFPIPYLKQGKVVGCFDDEDNLCGGFAVILNGPFRVIESIPISTEPLSTLNLHDTAEITGLWLSSNMLKKNQSLRFWLKVFFTLLFCGKKHFVYAYTLKNPKLGKIYQNGRPVVLFKGVTKILPGMKCADEESVEVIHRNNFFLTPFRHPEFLFKRFKGLRRNRHVNFENMPGMVAEKN